MNTDSAALRLRLDVLERKHGAAIHIAPPQGVTCDCDWGDEHFHIAPMVAMCDNCGTEVKAAFFAYTQEEGHNAIFAFVREMGWATDRSNNLCFCPRCRMSKAGKEVLIQDMPALTR